MTEKGFLTAAVALFLLLVSSFAARAGEVAGVRVWEAPDHVRVVFDLTAAARHEVFTLQGPDRVVVDLLGTRLATDISTAAEAGSSLLAMRSGVRNGSDLRIVLDTERGLKPRSFLLPPNPPYGNRLVIDLFKPDVAPVAEVRAPDPAEVREARRDIVVAVDAGHGGEDPGAIGSGRILEKEVVLAIARELKRELDATEGFRGELVRTGDYYIGLRKRTEIARKKQADLFISIHADAFKSPKAHGASVYVLSPRGATSETAQWLAQRENKADLIGGVGSVSLGDKDEVLAGVLLDLSMTASMSASEDVGSAVLKSVGRINHLHKRRIEKAGFVVLKSPDIPSILVETGFISNPGEAKKLSRRSHQKEMARSLMAGIEAYFEDAPPPGTLLAWRRQQTQPREYVIVRGDTLSEIAARHGVSIHTLRKANGLKNDQIRIGQRLTIPAS